MRLDSSKQWIYATSTYEKWLAYHTILLCSILVHSPQPEISWFMKKANKFWKLTIWSNSLINTLDNKSAIYWSQKLTTPQTFCCATTHILVLTNKHKIIPQGSVALHLQLNRNYNDHLSVVLCWKQWIKLWPKCRWLLFKPLGASTKTILYHVNRWEHLPQSGGR